MYRTVKGRRLLSVSTRGLVAFTSSFCLSHTEPRTVAYHIYVADVNTPYQPYLIAESDYDITVLEWDPTSKKLLACTTAGTVTIFTSVDYLISDWKPHYIKKFPGEVFLNGLWYHHGISTCINLEKVSNLNDGNYGDKFQQTNFGASVKLFGSKAAEGCILLTQTGLVCCITLLADGSILMDTDCLDGSRSKIEVADIAYRKNGGFLMATTAGYINSMISFYLIDLKLKNVCLDDVEPSTPTTTRLTLTCQNFCSFYLNLIAQILQDKELLDVSSSEQKIGFRKISHIKFDTKNAPKEVFVEVSGTNLSLIELWTLESEKPLPPVHPSILSRLSEDNSNEYNNNNQDFVHSTWSFYGNYANEQELVTMTTPRFPLFSNGYQLNLIFLTYKDHTVRCLRKDDLQQLFQPLDLAPSMFRKCSPGGRAGDSKNCSFMDRLMALNDSLNKQSSHMMGDSRDKSSPLVVTDFQLSCNQCGAFVIDSLSQIHALKLPLLIDCQDSKDHQTYIQCLLEFCLFTGNDWWDLIIQVEQNSIGLICENLSSNFDQQPKYIQEKFFNRQLMIRASLHRCQNSVYGLCKATDCHTMIKLNSISTTLKSILRSKSTDIEHRDSPAEYLSEFLKNQTMLNDYSDCSNVIVKMNCTEFIVEANQVQSLQQLNQWIADLAIFLMVSLPQQIQSKHKFPGAGLAFNSGALEMIRELLIIIKIWGLLNEACLPIIHKLNDQFDVISNLFKLVSGAYFSSLNKTDQKLDESLLDECCQLSNTILIPYLELILYPIGVASPLLYQSPLYLEYNQEPSVPKWIKPQSVEGAVKMNGERKIDVVRHISLGAHPRGNIRRCTRCNSVSLIKSSFRTPRSWDQRWISSCVCGGSWAQLDSPPC